MRQADRAEARGWLDRHGLTEAEPTPLLVARLVVRRHAKLADSVLLAAFLIGAALAPTLRISDVTSPRLSLSLLAVLVVGLLVAQWRLGLWVRRVDRRAGAQLSRRVAHPVELRWPAVLGQPYAGFAIGTFTSALLLAVSVLPVPDSGLRYGAAVVLIGLAGVGAGTVMQLRQVLASAAVVTTARRALATR